jgi:hypothetical protein
MLKTKSPRAALTPAKMRHFRRGCRSVAHSGEPVAQNQKPPPGQAQSCLVQTFHPFANGAPNAPGACELHQHHMTLSAPALRDSVVLEAIFRVISDSS